MPENAPTKCGKLQQTAATTNLVERTRLQEYRKTRTWHYSHSESELVFGWNLQRHQKDAYDFNFITHFDKNSAENNLSS